MDELNQAQCDLQWWSWRLAELESSDAPDLRELLVANAYVRMLTNRIRALKRQLRKGKL